MNLFGPYMYYYELLFLVVILSKTKNPSRREIPRYAQDDIGEHRQDGVPPC